MRFDLVAPCGNCPFRSDKRFYLNEARAREIATSSGIFKCHKTIDYDDDGDCIETGDTQACAGNLIMQIKEGDASIAVRFAIMRGMIDVDALKLDAPIYANADEFIAGVST